MKNIRFRAVVRAAYFSVVGLLLIGLFAYCYVYRDRMFPAMDTIVIYGRETCSITKTVRADLTEKGIPYVFADADIPAVDDEMWYKLGPEFKEKRIVFPIVHVAGKMMLTPSAEEIQAELARHIASSAQRSERDFSTLLNGADPVPHY